jgi:hypothetical protein
VGQSALGVKKRGEGCGSRFRLTEKVREPALKVAQPLLQ